MQTGVEFARKGSSSSFDIVWATQADGKASANGRKSIGSDGSTKDDQATKEATGGPVKFSLSPLRWPLLIGVCTFGFCNGFVSWKCFGKQAL